jgi:omega-6 fatty acid desaturase (delta-12 desaturase)
MTVLNQSDVPLVKRAPSEQPPFTIKQLRDAIPKHCFERSTLISSLYMVWDLILLAGLYYLGSYIDTLPLPTVSMPLVWLVWAFAVGSVGTGVWVVAHECGHYAYSDSKLVCDTVGLVLHSILLVPYHSWRISHAKHHRSTGDLERDEVFLPGVKKTGETPADMNGNVSAGRLLGDGFVLLVLGWPGYLLAHVTGRNYKRHTDHFNPYSPIFSPDERWMIILSDIAIFLWLGVLAYVGLFVTSPLWLFKYYVMPYLFTNFWLVLYTKLHHMHLALPHYGGSEWNWLRGALATIDRDYGFFNLVHHHIGDTHIVHHLFSTMPHYHAQEATEAIKPVLGKYYNLDTSPISTSLWQALKFCRYVEAEKAPPPNSVDGVYWFNVPTSTK